MTDSIDSPLPTTKTSHCGGYAVTRPLRLKIAELTLQNHQSTAIMMLSSTQEALTAPCQIPHTQVPAASLQEVFESTIVISAHFQNHRSQWAQEPLIFADL